MRLHVQLLDPYNLVLKLAVAAAHAAIVGFDWRNLCNCVGDRGDNLAHKFVGIRDDKEPNGLTHAVQIPENRVAVRPPTHTPRLS